MTAWRVGLVTDSAADLPDAWRSEHRIHVVPLTVRLAATGHDAGGYTEHLDGVDLTAVEFWERRRSSSEPATTASPSPAAFSTSIRQAAEDGAEAVVCVTLASGLSSTFQSAALAARDAPPVPVSVVDSGSACLGQAMVVRAAARAASDGPAAAVAAAREAASRVRILGVVDSLDHLRRSGRVTAVRAMVGSVLAMKPLVELAGGAVSVVGRQRTMNRALDSLVALVAEASPAEVVLVHADAGTAVEAAIDRLHARGFEPAVHLIGPVVGTHLGPGAIGVAFLGAAAPA